MKKSLNHTSKPCIYQRIKRTVACLLSLVFALSFMPAFGEEGLDFEFLKSINQYYLGHGKQSTWNEEIQQRFGLDFKQENQPALALIAPYEKEIAHCLHQKYPVLKGLPCTYDIYQVENKGEKVPNVFFVSLFFPMSEFFQIQAVVNLQTNEVLYTDFDSKQEAYLNTIIEHDKKYAQYQNYYQNMSKMHGDYFDHWVPTAKIQHDNYVIKLGLENDVFYRAFPYIYVKESAEFPKTEAQKIASAYFEKQIGCKINEHALVQNADCVQDLETKEMHYLFTYFDISSSWTFNIFVPFVSKQAFTKTDDFSLQEFKSSYLFAQEIQSKGPPFSWSIEDMNLYGAKNNMAYWDTPKEGEISYEEAKAIALPALYAYAEPLGFDKQYIDGLQQYAFIMDFLDDDAPSFWAFHFYGPEMFRDNTHYSFEVRINTLTKEVINIFDPFGNG